MLLLVGDFNARVGSSDRQGSALAWDGMRGHQGDRKLNGSGEVLLSFCAVNELSITHKHLLQEEHSQVHVAVSWE